jgi:hypothetical protein
MTAIRQRTPRRIERADGKRLEKQKSFASFLQKRRFFFFEKRRKKLLRP